MASSISTAALALAAPLSAEVSTSEFRPAHNMAGPPATAKMLTSSSMRHNTVLHKVGMPGATGQHRSSVVACSANLNDVAVSTPDTAPVAVTKPEVAAVSDVASASAETVEASPFMADVANLIKLVDSRDIVELEVKHKKYEILIRKKEAIKWDSPPQTQPGLHVMAHTAGPQYYAPPPSPPQPAFESAAAPPPPAAAPAPAKAAPGAPPMLSPMAGTFYRSPAPGEPSFVKVGDKVTKGQVVCIVEAMKLMNEIECDQTGTISDILLKDGSPVSIDTPLFAIRP